MDIYADKKHRCSIYMNILNKSVIIYILSDMNFLEKTKIKGQ